LLVAARDGSSDKLDQLQREAQPALWQRALQRLNDPTLADDVVARTFRRAWKHLAKYDPERSNASTWLYRILDQQIIDALKKRRSQQKREVLGFDAIASGTGEDGGDGAVVRLEPASAVELAQGEEAEQQMIGDMVREALGQLTPGDREVLEQFYFEGLSYEEIAARMAKPSEKAVGPRLTRARQRLLALLRPEALG
jgi:RNA polymerase sigma-70 factor (ECF subfamily)